MDNPYQVKITRYALEQLKETVSYLSYTLMEPQTAQRWLNHMEREMDSLSYMPNRIALTPEEPWHSQGIHRMRVKNYYIYFWIEEDSHTVWITAVLYTRRNQEAHLPDMSAL